MDKNIKENDIVKIEDAGEMYTGYSDWVVRNIEDRKLIANYMFNKSIYFENDEADADFHKGLNYRVLKIAPHIDNPDKKLAYIQPINCNYDGCFLIGIEGLKKIKSGKELIKIETELKDGDYVKIVNTGYMYTTYTDWIVKNIDDKELIAEYRFLTSFYIDNENNTEEFNNFYKNARFEVVKIAPYDKKNKNVKLAYIRGIDEKGCFLFNVKALKKIPDKELDNF